MSQDRVISDRFAALATAMHDEPSVAETLESVLTSARYAVACRHAGVMLVHGGNRVEVAAVAEPRLEQVDRIQVESGRGPGLEALAQDRPVLVADTHTESRWPRWAEVVRTLGVRSLLAVPLATAVTAVGTLNLYDPEPNRFDQDDVAIARIFARHAAVALASARNLENVWLAVDARKIVGQAQGILMERYGITADQALSVLMRYSRDTNTKLRCVAETVIRDRVVPAPAPGPHDPDSDG